MKRLVSILALGALLSLPPARGTEISPLFTTVWSAASGQKPNEGEQPWQLNGGNAIRIGKGSDSLGEGALLLDTPKKEVLDGTTVHSRTYIITNPRFWNPSKPPGGSTVEFRMRVESVAPGCSNAAVVGFSTGSVSFRLSFDTAGVITGQKEYIDIDTMEMHTYRITYEESTSTAHLYVDNADAPIATWSGEPSSTPAAIFFGSQFEASGGVSAWEYVAITNDGAYAPSQ